MALHSIRNIPGTDLPQLISVTTDDGLVEVVYSYVATPGLLGDTIHACGASLFLNGQLRECFAVQVDGRNVKVTGSSNNELLYGGEMKLRNLNDSDLPWDAEEIEKIVETEIALKDLNIFKHFPAIGGFVPKLRQLVGHEEVLLDVAGKESRLRAEQIYGAARDKKGERLIGCIIGGPVGCAISIGIFILLNTNFTQAH